jgi:hypothetical protein
MKLPLSVLIAGGIIAVIALVSVGWAWLGPKPAPGEAVARGGLAGQVVLNRLDDMPDWLLIAYQREICPPGDNCPRGEVHFNQRTITRNQDGTADIWIQVRHGVMQRFAVEAEQTITRVSYELERLQYRFNCENGEFIVVERQIMGPDDTVVARDQPAAVYRAPVQGSVTGLLFPIACRGE